MSRWALNLRGENHRAWVGLWRKEGRVFLSAVLPPCTSTRVMAMNIMIQQRDGRLPWCFLRERSVDCFFPIYNTVVMCLWRKQIKLSIGRGPFGTTADKLLRTFKNNKLTQGFSLHPSFTVNVWFNLASNSLDCHWHCVMLCGGPAPGARGNKKMSFSCSSVRPAPESHGYSHLRFKDKIIRGRFVEGSLHLNKSKYSARTY